MLRDKKGDILHTVSQGCPRDGAQHRDSGRWGDTIMPAAHSPVPSGTPLPHHTPTVLARLWGGRETVGRQQSTDQALLSTEGGKCVQSDQAVVSSRSHHRDLILSQWKALVPLGTDPNTLCPGPSASAWPFPLR